MPTCKSVNCINAVSMGVDFCLECMTRASITVRKEAGLKCNALSSLYPQYYKSVDAFNEVDVYAIHHLFNINDPSGCLQHASKLILLSNVDVEGTTTTKAITEARDTLNRWLQLNSNKN